MTGYDRHGPPTRNNACATALVNLDRWLRFTDIGKDLAVLFVGINFAKHDIIVRRMDDDLVKKVFDKVS